MMLDTTIYKAGEKAYTFTEEDFDAWVARRELITELDTKAQLEYAHNQGHDEGRTDGLVEGRTEGLAEGARTTKLELARAMLVTGLPADTVADLTQLTPDEITALQEATS